jgi:predicted patatin/cPLA2 family phospholipase
MSKTYKELREELKEQQSHKSYEEIKKELEKSSEFMLELDNLKPQKHLWTDRGEKMTCENAGHQYHEAWKRRKATV